MHFYRFSIILKILKLSRLVRSPLRLCRGFGLIGIIAILLSKSAYAQSPEAVLSIPEAFTITRSDTGQVIPISLDNAAVGSVRAVQIFITFPPDELEILGVDTHGLTPVAL